MANEDHGAAARRPVTEACWRSFARAVMAPDAPEVQHREMRRAFYAGVWQVLCVVNQIGSGEVDTRTGTALLESMAREGRRFKEDVIGGRA